MTVNMKFTLEELRLLATLAADQMFRREFIDPKMPGYRADRAELALGKALVVRLRSVAECGTDKKDDTSPRISGRNSTRTPTAPKVEADAV